MSMIKTGVVKQTKPITELSDEEISAFEKKASKEKNKCSENMQQSKPK